MLMHCSCELRQLHFFSSYSVAFPLFLMFRLQS
uniref:Uncharacterized protein n=1 Tax=Nelumbo nucifera TaxID=4432 RepID=A0A822YTG3_NELNU|nr:TPA_asm: hypothetical protein HUJ06_005481 [Nelumbo nucifera]